MITINQANGTGLRTSFENLRSFEGKIFDEYNPISIGESISIRVLDDLDSLRLCFTRPFMAASHTLPFFGMLQHVVHLAFRANPLAHRRMIESLRKATSKLATVGDATQDGSDVPDQDGINRDSTRSRHGPRRILVVMITSIYLLGTMEKYEITALEGVTILAYMPTTKLVTRSGFSVAMATSEKKWLKLTAGEKRNVGLVVGVHPDCLPSYTAMKTDDGYTSVQIESYSPESLPQVFYGLFSLACNY